MVSIDVDVTCNDCGKPLDVVLKEGRYGSIIYVTACEYCKDAAHKEGYDEGYDSGKSEGND